MRYAPAGYKFAIPLKDILILGGRELLVFFSLNWGGVVLVKKM